MTRRSRGEARRKIAATWRGQKTMATIWEDWTNSGGHAERPDKQYRIGETGPCRVELLNAQ